MWRWLLGLAVILGAVIGVFLGALNPDPVTLELVFIQWTASLGAIVALSICVGAVLGFAFAAMLMLFRRHPRPSAPAKTPEASKSLTDA
ncbi:MAG TPA: LapA family protein [Wenzhouxiangellaceae bacterium]|nr:LapA family protein [Wenzhouxiangellaceae bacterium]